MMFAFDLACRLPTVTTPNSLGAISRDTMPWRRITIAEARTTGSIPR